MSIFVIGDPHLSEGVSKPMDVFGGVWENYTSKLVENWKKTIKENDTVVIAGDISWGMNLNEALADFKLIESLPGKKLLVKGNHDYWWDTVSKMKKFFCLNNITSIDFVYNNSFVVDGFAICGTRGWTVETENTTLNDRKIILREAGRLERSLASAPDDVEKLVFLHYPPIFEQYQAQEILDVMQKYDVKRCFYGHLHSCSVKKAKKGEYFGIKFYLVSADSIDFLPINI